MIFCRQIELFPKDHIVKVFSDRKIRVTAKELLRNSSIYASWLYQHGYSIVGIHMGNCPEFLYLFLGAMRAGVRVRLYNALKEATDPIPILDRDSAAAIISTFMGGQFLFSSYGSTEVEGISNFLYAFESINLLNRLILRILNRFVVRGKIIDKNTLKPNFAGTIRKNVRVKIVDNNKAIKDGEIGEIWVHTPLMIDDLKEKYFHTGDLGYKIGDHLYICGRHLNVINRSGEKIIPYEIQKAISGFEGVRSVLVFGIPSVSYGEDICVVIESRNGERVIEKEMLYDVLPKYMVPQHILFLDSIPLNGSGKEDMSAIYKYAIGEIGTDGNCGT